jgi:hypothetical protein
MYSQTMREKKTRRSPGYQSKLGRRLVHGEVRREQLELNPRKSNSTLRIAEARSVGLRKRRAKFLGDSNGVNVCAHGLHIN